MVGEDRMSEPAFTVPLNGVDVGFRDMTPGQLTMVNMILNRARKDAREIGEGAAALKMLGQIFNIIESTIISEEDREHVMDSMMTGAIDVGEAYLILRKGRDPEPDDDEDPKPTKTASARRVQKR
jgi:hypothetical protein